MERLSQKESNPCFQRTERLEKELADLKEQQQALNAQWQSEKISSPRFRQLKKRSTVNIEIQQGTRLRPQPAAELKYGKLTDLHRQRS